MKVISKLADIDFEFGHFEYKKDHLIIHSHKDSKMQSKVYVSPDDVVSALGKAFKVPMFWAYIVFFPFFLIRYRKRHAAKRAAKK